MTVAQLKTFIIGVLKGWFTNKAILDSFTEVDGKLMYKGIEVGGTASYATDAEVTAAIAAAIEGLNTP